MKRERSTGQKTGPRKVQGIVPRSNRCYFAIYMSDLAQADLEHLWVQFSEAIEISITFSLTK